MPRTPINSRTNMLRNLAAHIANGDLRVVEYFTPETRKRLSLPDREFLHVRTVRPSSELKGLAPRQTIIDEFVD